MLRGCLQAGANVHATMDGPDESYHLCAECGIPGIECKYYCEECGQDLCGSCSEP